MSAKQPIGSRKNLRGKLVGDKGYISQTLFERLDDARLETNHETAPEYEESICFDGRKAIIEKTSDYRNCQ